jgi:hypothetical protein
MLRTVGFREIHVVDQSFQNDASASALDALPSGQHMTVHAWR